MPTPVRVRGKRGNKRRIVQTQDEKRSEAAAATAAATTATPPAKTESRLEQLPTEILQDIFVWSSNFDLPVASPILYAKLTSEHVKKRFVLLAFADGEVNDHDRLEDSGRWDPADDEPRWSCLQYRILTMRWFSFSMLKQCRGEYLWRQLRKTVEYFHRAYPQTAGDNLLRDVKAFYDGLSSSDGDCSTCSTCSTFQCGGGPDIALPSLSITAGISKKMTFGKPARLTINIHHPHDTPRDEEDCWSEPECGTDEYGCAGTTEICMRMPLLTHERLVPNRLIQGPWNDDKIGLLKWLLEDMSLCECDGECYEECFHRQADLELASQGLMDAIRSYCAPAIALLARPSDDPWYLQLYDDGMLGTTDFDKQCQELNDDYKGSETEVDMCLFSINHISGIGVPVQEKHLVAALETAESRGDDKLTIYRWLLPVAVLGEYDREGPRRKGRDLFTLVEWAIKKKVDEKAKGVENGIGLRALEALDQEQHNIRMTLIDTVMGL